MKLVIIADGTVLYWFESHRWSNWKVSTWNNGERGIDQVKEDLKLLLLVAMDETSSSKTDGSPTTRIGLRPSNGGHLQFNGGIRGNIWSRGGGQAVDGNGSRS